MMERLRAARQVLRGYAAAQDHRASAWAPSGGQIVSPWVARMNLTLARAVAGLAFSACRVAVTWPTSQVAMWMLLICNTSPRSDLQGAPSPRR